MKEYAMMSREEKWTCLEQEILTPEQIHGMARDADEDMRLFLAEALCNVHTSASEQGLLHLMDDPVMQIRAAACDSACWCSTETVLEKLLEKSLRDAWLVRGYAVLSAADVLLNMDMVQQQKGLVQLQRIDSREKSVWVKLCCAQALYRLGDEKTLYRLISGLSLRRYNYRCCAVNLLMDIASESNRRVIQAPLRSSWKLKLVKC
ncbi:MAG: HEAT repeat domain-containing protein [Ruminococcus sp.]|nr:HEAT repeat domain-containing protein [Ruminococcus sp.]